MTIQCCTLMFCEWNLADIINQSSISTSTLTHFNVISDAVLRCFFIFFPILLKVQFYQLLTFIILTIRYYLHSYYYMNCISNTTFWVSYELEVYQESSLKDIAFLNGILSHFWRIFSDLRTFFLFFCWSSLASIFWTRVLQNSNYD